MAVAQLFTLIGLEPGSRLDLAKMVESGLPLSVISALKQIALTSTEISEVIVSSRALNGHKTHNEPLSIKESDRVVRVAHIVTEAERVFASRDKALLWLRTPDDLIDNRAPLKLLVTEGGARLVESLLQQIDEGVYT